MKYHSNLDENNEKFSCVKCLRKFQTKYQIQKHIKWHRLEETRPNEFHRICEFCGMHLSTGNLTDEKSVNMRAYISNLLTQTASNKSSPQYKLRLQSQRLARLDVLKPHLQDIKLPYREVQNFRTLSCRFLVSEPMRQDYRSFLQTITESTECPGSISFVENLRRSSGNGAR